MITLLFTWSWSTQACESILVDFQIKSRIISTLPSSRFSKVWKVQSSKVWKVQGLKVWKLQSSKVWKVKSSKVWKVQSSKSEKYKFQKSEKYKVLKLYIKYYDINGEI